jgi:hypothetical protein
MNPTRREFLKGTALAGVGLSAAGLLKGDPAPAPASQLDEIRTQARAVHPQSFNMCGYVAPKLDTVRIGMIGLGNRGGAAVKRLSTIDGIQIVALGDVRPEKVQASQAVLAGKGHPAQGYSRGEEDWKKICERGDIDLVYICTPWDLHTPMAVYAMESGKHALTEVPSATTIDQCWQLVETSERTRRYCKMLENCCYDTFELLTLNMARQGFFGDIVHGEGAYIHHHVFEENFDKTYYSDMWRLKENMARNGNLYPTHGLGPICQIMNINRGDRLDYLVSVSSNDFQMAKRADELAAQDPFYAPYAHKKFRGNMNTSGIRTQAGKTIMLQHDVTSPRVYSRLHLVSGTKAVASKYPAPPKIATGDDWLPAADLAQLEARYMTDLAKMAGGKTGNPDGHAGADFVQDWRWVYCLRNGVPLDHDVYDAALWSSIAPLSEWSVANRSAPIDIPDFTNGKWQSNVPAEMGAGVTA